MPLERPQERRFHARFAGKGLSAHLRVKGRFGRVQLQIIDFNRHGLAAQLEQPLPKDQLVYLSLDSGTVSIARLIGVVHNCLAMTDGYRCGIRFRTESARQFDRSAAEAQLKALEQQLRETPSG